MASRKDSYYENSGKEGEEDDSGTSSGESLIRSIVAARAAGVLTVAESTTKKEKASESGSAEGTAIMSDPDIVMNVADKKRNSATGMKDLMAEEPSALSQKVSHKNDTRNAAPVRECDLEGDLEDYAAEVIALAEMNGVVAGNSSNVEPEIGNSQQNYLGIGVVQASQPGAYALAPAAGVDNQHRRLDIEEPPDPLAEGLVPTQPGSQVGDDRDTIAVDSGAGELVEANLVLESAATSENDIMRANPVDLETDALRREEKNRESWRYIFRLMAGVLVVILFIGLGLGFGLRNKTDSHDSLETATMPRATVSPTSVPSAAPSSFLRNILLVTLPDYSLKNLEDPLSPQYSAYTWLENHPNATALPGWRIVQLFALSTFYYAMQGPTWPEAIRNHWLQYSKDECYWFSNIYGGFDASSKYVTGTGIWLVDPEGDPCDSDGHFKAIVLHDLNVNRVFEDSGGHQNQQPRVPKEITLLSHLESLVLPRNGITGKFDQHIIPFEVFDMPRLATVDLTNNALSGTIPSQIGLIKGLQGLDLSQNMLTGSIITELLMMSKLEYLAVWGNVLTGEIPSQVGLWSAMTHLAMGENPLQGSIPTELGILSNMSRLNMWNNPHLTGTIPTELGLLTRLTDLSMGDNLQTGTLPTELGLLTKMLSLGLFGNAVNGKIPSQLGILTAMTLLSLGGNNLSGNIPTELGLLSSLTTLAFWEFPQLSGSIPWKPELLTNLTQWINGGTQLSWELPTEIGLWSNLEELNMWASPNMEGSLPTELGLLTAITTLSLGDNRMTSTIPSELGLLTALSKIGFWNNQINGTLPITLGSCAALTELTCGGNAVSGAVPTEIGLLSALQSVNTWGTALTSSIPTELGMCAQLTSLSMGGDNMLSATVPTSFGLLTNMHRFELHTAGGSIPSELGSWTALKLLKFGGSLEGPVPSEIGKLTSLEEVEMWGYYNGEAFELPSELGLLSSNLRKFSIQDSYLLNGGIPSEIGLLSSLSELSLPRNSLSSTIPSQIGKMKQLETLRLSQNSLSGILPEELDHLVEDGALRLLQVEMNILSGVVSSTLCEGLGRYNDSDAGLSFDCSSNFCGCEWCQCTARERTRKLMIGP